MKALTPEALAKKRAAGLKGSAAAAEKRRQAKLAPPVKPDDASHPALAPPVKPLISGRTKQAIDLMVWEGATRAEAAKKAMLSPDSMRIMLTRPNVKAYYAQQLQVLRDGERVRNIHRAIAIRDAADNMPAINAIKWLEGEPEQTLSRGGTAQGPGVTFVIVGSNASVGTLAGTPTAIDANANDINDIDDE